MQVGAAATLGVTPANIRARRHRRAQRSASCASARRPIVSTPEKKVPQRRGPDGSGPQGRRLVRVAGCSVVGQTEGRRRLLECRPDYFVWGVSGEGTRARVLRARTRAPFDGGFDCDQSARRGGRGRRRGQLARHRTRYGRCTGERRAVAGLAPTRRRSRRVADPASVPTRTISPNPRTSRPRPRAPAPRPAIQAS